MKSKCVRERLIALPEAEAKGLYIEIYDILEEIDKKFCDNHEAYPLLCQLKDLLEQKCE